MIIFVIERGLRGLKEKVFTVLEYHTFFCESGRDALVQSDSDLLGNQIVNKTYTLLHRLFEVGRLDLLHQQVKVVQRRCVAVQLY